MQVTEVKRQIQGMAQFCPFYVFTGAEIEAQRIYINKIAEVTGKPVKRIESVSEAFNRRASILKISNVFVCRDDADFWKSATEIEVLTELLGDNILILQMTNIDNRSKASKLYADYIVTFDYMDADVLYKYVQRECSLSDENAYDLISICERDYSRILLETNKIRTHAHARELTDDESFTELLQEGAITRPPKDAIFMFSDALLSADIGRAFSLLQECKDIGEPALRLISVLYSNLRRVLQVQACESADIGKEAGLSAWDIKLAKQSLGAWTGEDLVFFLKTLQSVEQGIKTGEIEEDIAIDYLMVSIL